MDEPEEIHKTIPVIRDFDLNPSCAHGKYFLYLIVQYKTVTKYKSLFKLYTDHVEDGGGDILIYLILLIF
jgi:hypothetical protein